MSRAGPSVPMVFLRLEGVAALGLSLLLFADHGHSWILFIVLLLAPDLSMVGYLAGPRVGALTYNLAHTYTLPVGLGVLGLLSDTDLAVSLGLIWAAHIGVDRSLGYGLKYATGFKDTHLGRV